MDNNKRIPGGNELLNPADLIKNKLGVFYGAKAADLGCGGAGYFALEAAQVVGPEGIVYAVDILKSALSNVETRAQLLGLKNIRSIWSNLEKFGATNINNDVLDFALLINILFQNKNQLEILKEAARMLKKGGKLLVIDWQVGRFPIGPKPEDKISPEKIVEMARTINLTVEQQFEAGQFHYGVVLIK
ncbi:MAG TPA: methyltransferase domain-containing protein [bacterium]|nr:methyltransferase domain-containing protein [bacterium]HPL95429.1 methyltransferase domain-containing protein [bacterium]